VHHAEKIHGVVDVFSALVRTLEVCEMEWVLKTLDLMFLVCEDYDLRGILH